ncbi:MAG: nucleotidyltransferase family protein [Thaumarchaeota archaeon]|nr:nucleotidyltransferase family protein [Nitrososphaerota archaeon]
MKAVILSGGMGKRLKPLTDYLPKSLVPVDSVPIIEWQIRYFKKFGVDEIIVCAGYRAEQIISFFEAKDFGVGLGFSVEREALGTGGAIRHARRLIGQEDFFVINGDVITNLDLKRMAKNKNSMAVIPLRTNFGVVHLKEGKVEKFEEKPELSNYWMNAGIYYLQNDVLRVLPKVGNIEQAVFPHLAESGKLQAVTYVKPFWYSIDSHKDVDECTLKMEAIHYEEFLSA